MRSTTTTGAISEASPAQPARTRALALPRVSPDALFLGALVLVGLALRLWFIAVNDIDPRYSAADDGDYYQRALRLAATGEYIDNSWLIRPPGHVFMFAGLLRIAMALGDPTIGIAMIRGVQVALSLLLVPLGYDMARRLFSRPAGLLFAAVLAIWFPLVELPALILSEPLFVFTFCIHCWLLVRWRDSDAPGLRRHLWLAAAGLVLGICALTRSPALYGSVFSLAFLLWETKGDRRPTTGDRRPTTDDRRPTTDDRRPTTDDRRPMEDGGQRSARPSVSGGWWLAWARRFLVAALAMMIPFAGIIAPWTIRNYVTYQRLIIIDTLGPVNLWMAMSDAVNEGRGEGEAKAILAGIPQEERQDFVSEDISRIVREDPGRLVRNFVPHFLHIWKAQFVEDFIVKVSFFTRPLREIWPIGALGDLIWLVFTAAAAFGLAARPRDGGFRLLAYGWIAYSCLTVMLIHVEPRYLLPIWLLSGLYGSAALGALAGWLASRRSDPSGARRAALAYARSPWGLVGLALCITFLALCFTYRNYPQLIAQGVQRELHRAEAQRALRAGDQEGAIAAYERMLAVDPDFVDGRTELARIYLDRGEYEAGWAALGDRHTHRGDVIRGALARGQGDLERAAFYFEDAEVRAGEDVQLLSLEWLTPTPRYALQLGNGLDFGYLMGFSFGEDGPPGPDGAPRTYRWLQGDGLIVLPLPEPLREGAVVRLRATGGLPGETPLSVTLGDTTTTLPVRAGEWRIYQVAVPPALAGQTRLTIRLEAPTFIPVQLNPNSSDARLLSVMISDVAVE